MSARVAGGAPIRGGGHDAPQRAPGAAANRPHGRRCTFRGPPNRTGLALLLVASAAACGGDATRPDGAPALPFAQLSAGFDRTCGITTEGELFCWGRRFNGDTASSPALAPRRVALTRAAAHVGVGTDHTCAVLQDGDSLCWGSGSHGALGRPPAGTVTVPAPGPLPERALSRIAAGGGHTCALADDGAAFCWGRGLNGELGTGRIEETPVPGPFGRGLFRFADISTGQHHSCGVDLDGRVLCSGWNVFGQLGVGVTVNLGAPQHILSDQRFAAVSAGRQHTCAITADGAAWCWGRGDLGQLGTGATTGALAPVRVAGQHRFASIAAGDEHTCAVTTEGAALCWGHNQFGRAGQPPTGAVFTTPTAVAAEVRFTRITVGYLHSCAIAADGGAWCWGYGGYGQLGNQGTGNRHQPTAVGAPEPPRSR